MEQGIDNLFGIWGGWYGREGCAMPRVRGPASPVVLHQPSPTPRPLLSVQWVESPSGGGDWYLRHPLWSEELVFRCQWVGPLGWLSPPHLSLTAAVVSLLFRYPPVPLSLPTRGIFPQCQNSVPGPAPRHDEPVPLRYPSWAFFPFSFYKILFSPKTQPRCSSPG